MMSFCKIHLHVQQEHYISWSMQLACHESSAEGSAGVQLSNPRRSQPLDLWFPWLQRVLTVILRILTAQVVQHENNPTSQSGSTVDMQARPKFRITRKLRLPRTAGPSRYWLGPKMWLLQSTGWSATRSDKPPNEDSLCTYWGSFEVLYFNFYSLLAIWSCHGTGLFHQI